ncbi:hypothetical protein ACVWXL_006623 [Bradyrhizobium sp. GM22.5]
MRIGQHHRAAREDGAEEYLQAAIAADVVERRPYRRGSARRAFGDDGAGECFQRMADDFRHARRARGEHQPFRGAFGPGRRCGLKRQLCGDDQRHASLGPAIGLVGDNGIDPGIRHQRVEMRRVEIRRAQQHAAGNTVELDHGKTRSELVGQFQQHRAAGQLAQAATQDRLRQDIRQRHDIVRVRQRAAGQLRAEMVAERKDLTRGHFRRPARNRPRWRGTLRPRKW